MTAPALPSPVPAPSADAVPPGNSPAVYGMPMFATLLAGDLDATVSWYVDGLGLDVLFQIPGQSGSPALVHLRRWQFQDLLLRLAPTGTPPDGPSAAGAPGAPRPGVPVITLAAVAGELDALAERARAHGGGQVQGPVDTPWNTRDLTTVDPDGAVVVFTAARPPEQQDYAFTADMHRWTQEQRG